MSLGNLENLSKKLRGNSLIKFYDTPGNGFNSDECQVFYVHQERDENPADFLEKLIKAVEYSIPLEYWRSDEFTSSYLAVNKAKGDGTLYVSNELQYTDYRYEVTCINQLLHIRVIRVNGIKNKCQLIFDGTSNKFVKFVEELEKKLMTPKTVKEELAESIVDEITHLLATREDETYIVTLEEIIEIIEENWE